MPKYSMRSGSKRRVGARRRSPLLGSRRNDYVHRVARVEANRVALRRSETKYFDTRQTLTTVNYSGTSQSVVYDPSAAVYLSQGPGETAYLGQKIRPLYVTLRGAVTLNGDAYNICRIIIAQVKGSVNDTPNPNKILQSVSNFQTPLTNYDVSGVDKVKILADRMLHVDTYNPTRLFKIRVPMRKMTPMTFSDNAGTTLTGGIVMYFYSDSSGVTDPIFEWYSRIGFKDS